MSPLRSVPKLLVALLFLAIPLAGCLSDDVVPDAALDGDMPPFLDHLPIDPDPELDIHQFDVEFSGAGGTVIHARIVKPVGDGPFPVIAQFTPYTAPGQNAALNVLAEPYTGCTPVAAGVPGVTTVARTAVACEGRFDHEFVRRGYAFAYGDVRGTGDSSGCLDLRGQLDIDDLARFTQVLGEAEWSNGNVGFIGASYPGSEAHMAGIAADPHLKAIVPIVASTSFYHYHHNGGVPYNGQHSLGGTNTGYTRNAIMPTVSPQSGNYVTRYAEEAQCPTHENVLFHGGLDQTGAYYDWWQERNLRERAATIDVPVLMAQGLADWNVKPDHIASWFNDLDAPKTLIAGQWHHAYPYSTCTEDRTPPSCDDAIPYGDWWQYVTAFFDTFLKEEDTGMFATDVAWVQDTTGAWHRSADWPLLPEQRDDMVLHLQPNGALAASAPAENGSLSWYGCADDQYNMGQFALATAESTAAPCDPAGKAESVVFETEPFADDVIVSGVPQVAVTLESETAFTHLVVLVEVLDADGELVQRTVREEYDLTTRENYGYLNPTYRNGIDDPQDVPVGEAYAVMIDLFPQEDVVKTGERLRVTLSSDDDGRTIEAYESGTNTVLFGPDHVNTLTLPLRPPQWQGVRLPVA